MAAQGHCNIGKLREHELEMKRLKEHENEERKARSLALKLAAQNEDNSKDDSSEYSDAETLNMLTRRFQKFLKKKGKEKNQQAKRYNRKSYSHSINFICFGCWKQGHTKIEFSNLVHKE